jgi:anti-anti-sigma factor
VTRLVREVMVPVRWTVAADCPLAEAARLMRSWDVKEVYVVDDGALRGVLTDVDIVVLAIASGRSPTNLVAGDGLAPGTVSLQSDEPIVDALARLRQHGLRRAPVVDGDRLVGAAWVSDLELASQREQATGQPSTGRSHRRAPVRRTREHRPAAPAAAGPGPAGPVPLVSTPLLQVTAFTDGAAVRVAVAGELDLSTTPAFAGALDRAFDHGVDLLTVDLDDLTFADSSAIHALLRLRATAEERGTRLCLTNVAGSLRRTLTITGMHELFDIAHR